MTAPPTGRAAAWGFNGLGELGDDSTVSSPSPVAVYTRGALADKYLTATSSGYSHSCVVADGHVYCWGYNGVGELGNNSTANSTVPVAVDTSGVLNGRTVTAISAGVGHTCAVADGRVYCWGRNTWGQLGDNSVANSTVPVAVDTSGALQGKTVTAISAGLGRTCVVADGRAYCWGLNENGELGNNSTTDSHAPVAVDIAGVLSGRTVTAIGTGYYHSCAVADGRAYCWGANGNGELGNNSTTDSHVPVLVDISGVLNGKTVTAISAGLQHTVAVADGRAYGWGANYYGLLGNNSIDLTEVPVAVDTSGVLKGKTVTAISAGFYYHTCAVADGGAYCWGLNQTGQLGDNSTTDSKVPVGVDTTGTLAGKKIVQVAVGSSFTTALAAAVPQPPTGVKGAPGNGQVTVSWTTSADDGGSPIEQYVATSSPGGLRCTASTTSCTVSGLSNGTAYRFTVTARNAIGTSSPSGFSPVATPLARAGRVKGLKVTLRMGTAKFGWKKAARADSYRLRISKPGGRMFRPWRITTKRVYTTTVRKGSKYRFQIAAVGPGGRGPGVTIRFRGK
ncbi:MAG: fibronectin type III domain-containing protein [Candidatus Nanopelagicales bacterium]